MTNDSLGRIREIVIKMGAVRRALEVAKLHYEDKRQAEAEIMFNVALDVLAQIPQSDREFAVDGLEQNNE